MSDEMLDVTTLEGVFEAVDIPTILLGADERLLVWNTAMADLVDVERSAVTGLDEKGEALYDGDRQTLLAEKVARHPETAHEVYDGVGLADEEYALLRSTDGHVYEDTSTATAGSGAALWFVATPLFVDGEFVGVLEFVQEQSESERRRTDVEQLVEQLDDALRCIQEGDVDIQTDIDVPDDFLTDEERNTLDRVDEIAQMRDALARQVEQTQEAKRQLERSNEALEQFAYIASHDLQEPLRMVSSYLELLENEYRGELDEEAEEYIDYAVDGAERMRSMIDALLAYSRVETRAGAFEPTDVTETLTDVRQDLELKITENDATITSDDLPTVEADPDQLRQVFQNLLTNAIEHAGDAPPTIHVGYDEREDAHCFSVSDEGVGIPEDSQDEIFDIFDQGGRDESGTGIGLAVCRRIVERHDGDIWVESTPGEGTTFSFTIEKGLATAE